MNKFKFNILALGAICLSLFACSESYLDVDPQTSILEQNFYQTEDDAEMALVGCYDGYQRTSSNGNFAFYVASEVLSDNCFGGTGNTDDRKYQVVDRFDISQSTSDNNIFNSTWADYYAAIFRCNKLLQKLPDIASWNSTDEAVIATTSNRIEGETRFLRANLYFELVRLFENIPLLTEPTNDNVPQADPVETYKLIVEDLQFAIANIPADAYPKADAANNDGRVTKYAAEAMLARVYMFYSGYYGKEDIGVTKAEALAGLEDIISSNEFALVSDFKSLWPASSYKVVTETKGTKDTTILDKSGYAQEGNSEIVFAEKFNNTSNYKGMSDGNRWLVMMGMRNTNWSPYGKGWGACTVNPELVSDFAAEDTRKAASIIDIAGEGIESSYDIKDQREYTGYSVKKYSPICLPDNTTSDTGGENDFQLSQDQDYVVIRYADVLLMAAELGSANALNYFNMVHTRAGLSAKTSITTADILNERRFEFAFEGIRYWDLLRQGLSTAASTIAQTQDVLSGKADDVVTIDAANITAKKGFMQIPETQITLSDGVLVQNAGW